MSGSGSRAKGFVGLQVILEQYILRGLSGSGGIQSFCLLLHGFAAC